MKLDNEWAWTGDSGIPRYIPNLPDIIWAVTHDKGQTQHAGPLVVYLSDDQKRKFKKYVNKRAMSVQVLKQSIIAWIGVPRLIGTRVARLILPTQ